MCVWRLCLRWCQTSMETERNPAEDKSAARKTGHVRRICGRLWRMSAAPTGFDGSRGQLSMWSTSRPVKRVRRAGCRGGCACKCASAEANLPQAPSRL